jgi:hypothetical protein
MRLCCILLGSGDTQYTFLLRVCCEWECHPGASMQLMQVHALERYSLLHVVYACACNIDMSVLQ